MYESHFGLTGAPFSLNPDPAFFFGSRGHAHALAYLKFGVYQGEGFVVVTGEIGAGKTTLVRTLLSGLDTHEIVAAQIVSTQLEAGDLLRSVALAFGIAPSKLSKAELIATIEAFLTQLVTENRRALLVVDEAQNLQREAVEELRMLSNFQLGNRALLQSFLVGQPELRALLNSQPLEQFRQRVIASCHLGPMNATETRAYIEHRLRQVGWTSRPHFDDGAFARVFHWTLGIPRRVNLLCNRVLLASYLEADDAIGTAMVDRVGREASNEVGASPGEALPAAAPASPELAAATTAPALRGETVLLREAPTVPRVSTSREACARRLRLADGPVLIAVGGEVEDVKSTMLTRALSTCGEAPHPVKVLIGNSETFRQSEAFASRVGVQADTRVVRLETSETLPGAQVSVVMERFEAVVADYRPCAVAVIGGSSTALACSLVAYHTGCALIHLEAGSRHRLPTAYPHANSALIDRLASLFYPSDDVTYLNLIREGLPQSRVQLSGNLLSDALEALRSGGMPAIHGGEGSLGNQTRGRAYGLVAADASLATGSADVLARVMAQLKELSRGYELIWPLTAVGLARLESLGLAPLAGHSGLVRVDPVGFVERVALLAGATVLVTDDFDMHRLAADLDVRRIWIGDVAEAPSTSTSLLCAPAGKASLKIAEHLSRWLTTHARSEP